MKKLKHFLGKTKQIKPTVILSVVGNKKQVDKTIINKDDKFLIDDVQIVNK